MLRMDNVLNTHKEVIIAYDVESQYSISRTIIISNFMH